MKFVRSTLQKTRRDRIKNEGIRNIFGNSKITKCIKKTKWFGNVIRMDEKRLPKMALKIKLKGKTDGKT